MKKKAKITASILAVLLPIVNTPVAYAEITLPYCLE